jgi:hypothetical protein
MTYENPRDPRDPNAPVPRGRRAQSFGGWLPLVFAAAVTIAVIALVYPRVTQTGDTNAGPSVQTITPAPSPTAEPRPTQAPQP